MINLASRRPRYLAFCATALSTLAAVCGVANADEGNDSQQELVEVRTFLLGEKGDSEAVDQYLSEALLPALERQGIGPIGVFYPAEEDENDRDTITLAIPYQNAAQFVSCPKKLQKDPRYLADAQPYLDRGPRLAPYQRVSSELLVGMDCWPNSKVPDGTLSNPDRVYELRLYESSNERLGNLKVDMFNNGEVPIFLDCGIQPVFIGQCIVGPQSPNLTYLTMYPNEQARQKAWDAFRSHPDWQVLKKVDKYKGTVSKIDKYVLKAKPYSQM